MFRTSRSCFWFCSREIFTLSRVNPRTNVCTILFLIWMEVLEYPLYYPVKNWLKKHCFSDQISRLCICLKFWLFKNSLAISCMKIDLKESLFQLSLNFPPIWLMKRITLRCTRVWNCTFLVANATENFAMVTRILQLVASGWPAISPR